MKYDLVFEGGGAKGMVFVGACEEFFKAGHDFDRLLGTSAGAITAVLLAAGYSPKEMLQALVEKGKDGKSVFSTFMGAPKPFGKVELASSAMLRFFNGINFTFIPNVVERKVHSAMLSAIAENEKFRHLLSLVERGGWFSADAFVDWLEGKLEAKGEGFSELTLAELFAKTGTELSFVASDTTGGSMLVLNHRTAPDCPVVWAVRMSMSIPLLWEEVIWLQRWGLYQDEEIAGHSIVDGGLLSNFPIELFLSDAPQVEKLMGPKRETKTLGLLIDEQIPVPALSKGMFIEINIKPGELKTLQRLKRLIDTATGAHDKMVIEEYEHFVVRLPAQGYGTTEFDMSDDRREALVQAGRQAMKQYLAGSGAGLLLPTDAKAKAIQADPERTVDRIAKQMLKKPKKPNVKGKSSQTKKRRRKR